MSIFKNIFILTMVIVNGCVNPSSSQSANGEILLSEKLGVRKTIVSDSINYSFVQIDYRVDSSQIVFFFNSKKYPPHLRIDFNHNSALDENIDKQYGTIGGIPSALCVTYLLSKGATTPCGEIPTHATVSLQGDKYELAIPLNELKYYMSSYVYCEFTFFDDKTGWIKYPGKEKEFSFKNVYKILAPITR